MSDKEIIQDAAELIRNQIERIEILREYARSVRDDASASCKARRAAESMLNRDSSLRDDAIDPLLLASVLDGIGHRFFIYEGDVLEVK